MVAKEQINKDICEAAKEARQNIEDFISKRAAMLPPSFDFQCEDEVPNIVKAWTSLQIENGTPFYYHKSRALGEFIYDGRDWELLFDQEDASYFLGATLSDNVVAELPKGCISTAHMFSKCTLDTQIVDFSELDTSSVTDMHGMFKEGESDLAFKAWPRFNTSKVKNMCEMFRNAKFAGNVILGDSFDTSNVYNMALMFAGCTFKGYFDLGPNFNTTEVLNMQGMFLNCDLPEEFKLGSHFKVSRAMLQRGSCDNMFYGCKIGDKELKGSLEDILTDLGATIVP